LVKVEEKPVEDDKVACTITEEATKLKLMIDNTGIVFSEAFFFNITNFSKYAKTRIYSPNFLVGNRTWRLLLVIENEISIYLGALNLESILNGNSVHVRFQLSIVDQVDNTETITKSGEHIFSKASPEFGFTHIEVPKLRYKKNRYLIDDTLVVSTCINVSKDISTIKALDKEVSKPHNY